MGATSQRFPEVGEDFAGRYRIHSLLSESGRSGRLYAATDNESGEPVALKVVWPSLATDPHQIVQRFDREARALSAINSAACIRLREFAHVDGEALYMAFEWVDGVTLADEIARGPMSVARTLAIMRQLLEVLQELHTADIIHRDIKPSHIMLTSRDGKVDRVKLLDFAIAKSWTHTVEGKPLLGDLTAKGRMMGTPRYMSPEQVVGRKVVPQSDLYSLGLVVLEMLTGERANPGDDVVVVVQRHLSDDDFAVPEDLPEDLYVALRRMVAKPLNARPRSASEVLGMIGPLAVATEATAGDETIPVSSFVAQAQQEVGTDPNIPVLGLPQGEEPTLPPAEMGVIVEAAVANDETVKFDHDAAGHGPVPQSAKVAVASSARTFDPSDTGRIAIQREDAEAMEISFPRSGKLQTMVLMALAGTITFVVSLLLTPLVAPIGLLVVFVIYAASRVDRHLTLDSERWTLVSKLWRWDKRVSGAVTEIKGLSQKSGVVLMTTVNGTREIANGYDDHEALAVCKRANDWLSQHQW